MIVFLDFEASSLGKRSVPIEVAWVFEDGRSESLLIRPAPDWTDWDDQAQAIHGITQEQLLRDGVPHDVVAGRMVDALSGHALFASAPSWDGKWLSRLLRAGGFARHLLRLEDSDALVRETAAARLAPEVPAAALGDRIECLLAAARPTTAPSHRALADAEALRAYWLAVRAMAQRMAEAGE